MSSKSEMQTVTEQQTSQQIKTIKLEPNILDVPMPKPVERRETKRETEYQIFHSPQPAQEVLEERKTEIQDTGIETSSISKQSSLQYFVKKIKGGEPEIPAKEISIPEPIKPEVYQKFQSQETHSQKEISVPMKLQPVSEVTQSKMTMSSTQNIIEASPSTKVSTYSSSHEIIQGQSIPQQYSSYSSSTETYNLKPEPPAEICYSPKVETTKTEHVSERIKKISESQKELPPHEVPQGGVKIFPSTYQAPIQTFSEKTEKSYLASYQSSSSSHTQSHVESSGRPLSPRPEAIQMEKMWTPKVEIDKPLSVTTSTTEHHQHIPVSKEKIWIPEETKSQSSYSVHSTLEKKWTPEIKSHSISKESKTVVVDTPQYVQHYIGQVTGLHHESNMMKEQTLQSSSGKTEHYEIHTSGYGKEQVIEDRNVKPSEIIKSWPPAPVKQEVIPPPTPEIHPYVAPEPKTLDSLDYLSIRPVSVQDITDEVYLEPGPPAEIAYAPPPQESVPPPLPPKKEFRQAPPLPLKPMKHVEPPKKIKEIPSKPFERFPDLEPFPFKPDPEKPRHARSGPPPTPSKFIKGKFTDSDYESDFESVRIPAKWRPCASDTEEPSYKRVKAPKATSSGRSRSTEPEPLPPSKFDNPPQFQGPPRPQIDFQAGIKDKTQQIKKFTKHVRDVKRPISPPKMKPGSPPVFVQAEHKPTSPKTVQRVVIDGYSADTDEPFFTQQQKRNTKIEKKRISTFSSSKKVRLIYCPECCCVICSNLLIEYINLLYMVFGENFNTYYFI